MPKTSRTRPVGIILRSLLVVWSVVFALSVCVPAQASGPADAICPRFAAGAAVSNPPELRSQHGVLETTLHFRSAIDSAGLTRYCYVSDSGLESPTLRLRPGDKLIIHFRNDLASVPAASMVEMQTNLATHADAPCSATTMSAASTNMHFHGINIPPVCHQDEVVHTLVQPGEAFDYQFVIPSDEPPGMYWYHPHPHGFSEAQAQGGATGAIIVEGIDSAMPSLAGLPERILILRDQALPADQAASKDASRPTLDLSLNFVPILYPAYVPAVIQARPSQQEFWRVANSASDSFYDIRVLVHGSPIPLHIYAMDGVPVRGGQFTDKHIILPPGSRVEFALTTPALGVTAELITAAWDAGPDGDNAPQRRIAQIVTQANAPALAKIPHTHLDLLSAKRQRLTAPVQAAPIVERELTFSENGHSEVGKIFHLTVSGQVPAKFDMRQAPNLVVHQGTIENWTIQNSAFEDHVFHIHQVHFRVLEVNGVPIDDPAVRDTINVPHWNGHGDRPSVKIQLDFRNPGLVGVFPYHCHILQHEDGGMMGLIEVLPAGISTTTRLSSASHVANLNSKVQITSVVTPASAGREAPSGVMQFSLDKGASMWQVPITNGRAVLTTSFANTGTHTLTAIYQGDKGYSASQSQPFSLTVPTRNFRITAASRIVLHGADTSGSTAIDVVPMDGFSSRVNLSCQMPVAMAAAHCSFAPTSILGSGRTILTITQPSLQYPASAAPSGTYIVTITGTTGSAPDALTNRLQLSVEIR